MTRKNICIISLIGLILGIIIDPYIFGFCVTDKSLCIFDSLANILGKPLIIIFSPIFIVSVIMFSFKEQVFNLWIRFVYFWFPITVLLVMLAPEYDNSLLNIQRDSIALLMASLLLVGTAIIVAYNFFKLSKEIS
ncbi:MAG: hypothetical protein Q7R72_00570 [bacterium]|nr:hypothetical protein [bacterium]